MRSLVNLLVIMALIMWSCQSACTQPIDAFEASLEKLKAADAGNYQQVFEEIVQQHLDFDTAKALLEKILQVSRKFSYKNAIPDVLRKLGDLHKSHQLYADSYTYYKEALQVAETYHLVYEIAKVKTSLGALMLEQFMFDKGIVYYLEAADLFKQHGYQHEVQEVFLVLGSAYYHGRDFLNATRYYRKVLNTIQNNADLQTKMWATNNLGLSFYKLNKYDSALSYYQKSLEIAYALPDSFFIGLVSGNIGVIYMNKGKLDKASKYLKRDIQLSKKYKEWGSTASAMISLATVFQKKGDFERASQYLDSAHLIVNQHEQAVSRIIYLNEAHMRQYELQQDYKKAFEYLSQVTQLKDSLQVRTQMQEAAVIDAAYNFDKKLAEINYLHKNSKLQRTVIGVFSISTLMLFIFSLVLGKLIRHRTQANRILAQQKQEIEQHNTALQIQKDKSLQQNRALEKANEQISVLNKKLEQKVRFSEEILRSAYENTSEAYFIMRAVRDRKTVKDFVCLDVNRAAEQLLHLTKEELLGKKILNILPFVGEDEYFDILTQVFEENIDLDQDIYLGEGGTFPAWVQITANQIEGGIAIKIKDITERKEAEVALRESEERVSLATKTANIGIWDIDLPTSHVIWDETMKDIYGLKNGEVQNLESWDKYLYPDDIDFLKKETIASQKGKGKQDVEFRIVRPDGQMRYIKGLAQIYRDQHDQPVRIIGVNLDITDQKENEEKLKQQHQEIIKKNKKIAEYKLMALRSVMNPHFLFNSLNSIQFFIAKNEREQALNYLSLFSKLIRGILNSSVNSTITLAQELEILKYYVELESLRFENKFEADFVISDDIDIDNLEIPSLLIQPYVENAIIHGLYNKEGRGKLTVSLSQHKNLLQCVVEDNGVGRKEALCIKKQNTIRHKSVGMMVTKERLDIINTTNKVSVKIHDLRDERRLASGTSVEILIQI